MGKKQRMHPATRRKLTFTAKTLYEQAGGTPGVKGATVRAMVSILRGRPTSRLEAWVWLAEKAQVATGLVFQKAPKAFKPKIARSVLLDFYNSREWRAVRFGVLRASNGCCCLCGQNNREHGAVLHVDHIKPRSLYPQLELDPENLQVLCEACNLGKSNRDDTDWRIGR
jgi:hypothetical protein